MRILKNRFVREFVIPSLVASMAAGPVWATDYSDATAVVRSTSGSDIAADVVNVSDDLTVTGSDAITIQGTGDTGGAGTANGITITGTAEVTSSTGSSIQINDGATLTASIANDGHLADGITISGDITVADGVIQVEDTDGYASIFEGVTINGSSTVSSSTSSTVTIGENGYIDTILVDTGSSLTAAGSGNHAISVESNGKLGGNFFDEDVGGGSGTITRAESDTALDINGTVSAGAASAIDISGTAVGKIAISGTVSGQQNTTNDGTGAITIGGTYTGTIDIETGGAVNDAIVITGTHSATNDAISSDGKLGNSTSETVIQVDGTLSSTSGNAIDLGGTISGSIVNNESISDGIVIGGIQTASDSAYQSVGSSGDVSTLTGGLTVSGTMETTGNSSATIHINDYSSVDTITVTGNLANSGTSENAILIDDESASVTDGIVNSGTITGNITNQGTINNGINSIGTINGGIANSGTITGGIIVKKVTGLGEAAYSQTAGSLTGDFNITGDVTSDQDGTISVTGGSVQTITIASGAFLTSSTGGDAIKIATGVTTGAISNSGTISDSITNSGTIESITNTSTGSFTDDITNDGVITDGIINNGTFTGSIINSGTLGDEDSKGITNTNAFTGDISNSGTLKGISNSGTLTGSISNTNSITGGISSTGTLIGNIINSDSITGGITINEQTSIGAAAYSQTDGSLTGDFNITGNVTSDQDGTINISGGSIETITIASGVSLTSSTGGDAIKIATGVTTGAISNSGTISDSITNSGTIESITNTSTGSFTDDITNDGVITDGIINNGTFTGSIINSGTLGDEDSKGITNTNAFTGDISNSGTLKGISNSGTLTGSISNTNSVTGGISSTGTLIGNIINSDSITGGITINEQTSIGAAAYSQTDGSLTGDFNITGNVTSDQDGTINISGGSIETITIASGASLTSSTGGDAIKIATGVTTGAISNSGTISDSITNSGTIESITNTSTSSFTDDITNDGVITDGIINNGTFTGSIINRGTLGDEDSKGITNTNAFTGDISNSGTLKGISNSGTLTGSISNTNSITGGISSTGTLIGGITNSQTITGGITVKDQTATGVSAYVSQDSDSTLTGGLTITGDVTSNQDTINLLNGSVDNITINSGASLATTGTNTNAIELAANADITGTVLINGALTGDVTNAGDIGTFNNAGTFNGQLSSSGDIDSIVVSGTQTSSGDAITITNTVGTTSSSNAIHVTSTGVVNAGDDKAIYLNGGTMTGSILNEGQITGDVVIGGTQTLAPTTSSYRSTGAASLNGSYTVANNKTVSTATDTVSIEGSSSIERVSVEAGSTLTSTGENKRAVYIAEGASLNSGAEGNEVLNIAGTLSSSKGPAIDIKGGLTGKLFIDGSGVISGKGGSTDAAILLDGSDTFNGYIENHGAITGGIYIDKNQTASSSVAYLSRGDSNDDWAILSGGEASGYTVDSNTTVTSSSDSAFALENYAYVDAITIDGTLSSTSGSSGSAGGESAIHIGANSQLGGSITSTSNGITITRSETDAVIEVDGTLSSESGYAIEIDGTVTGAIKVDNGATLSGDTSDGSILVDTGGTYTGTIENQGKITGDIIVSGTHTASSGELYRGESGSILTGSYVVNGGTATAINHHGVYLDSNSTVTTVKVTGGGTLTSQGAGDSAIYVESSANVTSIEVDNGTVNGTNGSGIGIDNHDVAVNIGSSGIANGAEGSIAITGTSDSTITNNGTMSADLLVKSGATYTGTFNNNHDSSGVTNKNIFSGTINNDATMETITNTGTLSGTVTNNADGTITTITNSGTLLGTITNNGTITTIQDTGILSGVIDNNKAIGTVSLGGTSSANTVYKSLTSDSTLGELKVIRDGVIGANGTSDTIQINDGSITLINVEEGGTLTSDSARAIYVASGGLLGATETQTMLNVDGTLSSAKSAALLIGGTAKGVIDIGTTGTVSGDLGAIAITNSFQGTIDNSGTLADEIVITGDHVANSDYAIIARDGSMDGIIIGSAGTLTSNASGKSAVIVGVSGSLGSVYNEGVITGGVEIYGTHSTSSVSAYDASGTSSVLDSYTVYSGGETYSTGNNSIVVGANSDLKKITVASGGTLTNKNSASSNNHAIYVGGSGNTAGVLGTLGGTALSVGGTLFSDKGNSVYVEGSILGAIVNTGRIEKGITIEGSHTDSDVVYLASGSNSTDATLLEGYNLEDGAVVGVTGASGSHTIHIGSNAVVDSINLSGSTSSLANLAADKNTIYVGSGGKLGLSETSTMMSVSGEIYSATASDNTVAEDSAILIDTGGKAYGTLNIASTGLIEGDSTNGAINIKGSYTGTLDNSGTITGGVIIDGSHITANNVVYARANTIDKYTVSAGATVGSTGDHAIYIAGGNVDSIVVDSTGANTDSELIGLLTSTAADKSAIYVADGGSLGDVTVNGQITSTQGHAIEIAGGGSGTITVGSTGLIASSDSSIKVSGAYQGRIENNGEISSGILVTGSHAAANDDAIYLGDGSTTQSINVSGTNARLATDQPSNSAVYVDDGAILGWNDSTAAILVENGALLDNEAGAAITVNGTVKGTIEVGAAFLGSKSEKVVIDFTNSDSALNFVHQNSSSVTQGSIVGSVFDDTLTIESGSFIGNTVQDIETLNISNQASITVTDDFILPETTRIQLSPGFADESSFITVEGEVSAAENGSTILFRPDSIDAYKEVEETVQHEIDVFKAQFDGPTVTLVDAESVADGTVDNLIFDSGSALINVNVSDAGGDLSITLEPNPDIEKDGVLQHALNVVLSQDSNDPEVQELFNVLNQVDENMVTSYAEERKRDAGGYLQMASREVALSSQNIVFDRMTSLRSGFNFGDSFGLGSGGDDEPLESRSDEGFGQKIDFLNRGGVWGQMMYLEGSQDKKGNEDGFKNRAGGFVLGIDGQFREHYRLGIAGTYGYGDVNTTGGRSIASHHFLGTLYGSWEQDRYFIDSMFTYGSARNESKDETGKVDRDNRQWNLRMTGGARLPLGTSWEFVPMAEMNYGKVSFDAFQTTQQGIPGTLEFQDYSALELGLGFTINGLVQRGEIVTRPDFMLMAHRDLNTSGVKGKFTYLLGGAPLTITSVDRDYERYHAGLGLNFYMANDWTIRTGYDYRWSKTYRSHSFNAKFRYEF